MSAGPVPTGPSTKSEDARTAHHAAAACTTTTDLGGTWPGDEQAPPPWLADALPPSWLDEEILPPDPGQDGNGSGADLTAGFAQGKPLDSAAPEMRLGVTADLVSGPVHEPAPGPARDGAPAPGGVLAWGAAVSVTGPSRAFSGVSDDELAGLLGARQRLAARQSWERYAVLAELIRRRPAPGCVRPGRGELPAVWAEGTAAEVAMQLAISAGHADQLLGMAWDLAVKLPATSARLRDGLLDEYKASLVARCCTALTPAEARQAEQILYAQPGTETMTPGMLRDRIARAVIEVNPDAARKRREDAARHDARITTSAEDSGNMMITGRELPPAAVLAMDQNITARARQLRAAGVAGSLRELRVLAFLEKWGAADPLGATGTSNNGSSDNGGDGSGPGDGGGPGGKGDGGSDSDPRAGTITPLVAANVHLTVPASTLTGDSTRPGSVRGAGPIDPYQARDLADAAAASDHSRWDCTITGPDGRPVAHACGAPAPRGSPPGGTGPPSFTRIGDGPDPRYGTWLYRHGARRIIFEFEHLAGACDHKHQAAGHDPGTHLRHLTAVLNQDCTNPACRTPEQRCDYEHSVPYHEGGRTCLCAAGPVCRRHHRIKQLPGWTLREAGARGWFRWTTPSGRSYLNGPAVYPV